MGIPRMLGGRVDFSVSRETAFDYLVEPRHRAEWQSSLKCVRAVAGEPRVGQTWTDVTKPGLQATMRTTELERPSRWSESGTWRFVRADLTLTLDQARAGCIVGYAFRIHALGPLGLVATTLALPAVRADLRRAARILAARPSPAS